MDDGSTDNTVDIVSAFGKRITLVQKKNGGAASAYNLGIKSATGDNIAFLEHDDIWLPEKIETQLDTLNSMTDVGLLFSTAQVLTAENSSKSDVKNLHTGQGYYSFSEKQNPELFNRDIAKRNSKKHRELQRKPPAWI